MSETNDKASPIDGLIMCEDRFKQRDLQRKFNRLYDLVQKNCEDIFKNPFEALDLAYTKVCEIEDKLTEIRRVFGCGAMEIEDGVTFEQPQYESMESILYRKQKKIQDILDT